MLQVSEILRVKGNTLFTGTPEMTVIEAVHTMSQHDIGSLVIMDQGELVGMLTFREIIRLLDQQDGKLESIVVGDIMNRNPTTVTPETDAGEVQALMLKKHARYLPVMEDKTLLGVISFYDMAQALVAAQRFENRMLKAYIRDWPDQA